MWIPSESTRLTKYPAQPTATVEAANRYSSSRSQPMNQPTKVPKAA